VTCVQGIFMSKNNQTFDITVILMTLFSALEIARDENHIELIYDIDATVPKELKGNSKALVYLLTQVLTFVFQKSGRKEIVLKISAPEDFLYKEMVTFAIRDTGIDSEKIHHFIKKCLGESVKPLEAEIEEIGSDIIITLPLKVENIGNRRHYRLPQDSMLGKKVLLFCNKKKMAQSLEKMFKYFLYEVDVGLKAYKAQGSNLSRYDMIVISDSMITVQLETLIAKVQQKKSLKYVIVQSADTVKIVQKEIQTAYLIKPVMQESIYELVISLFKDDSSSKMGQTGAVPTVIDMSKYINFSMKMEGQKYIESTKQEKKEEEVPVFEEVENIPILDTELGKENARKVRMDYAEKLESFLKDFKRSNTFFRQTVRNNAVWHIKEFLINLEKEARFIGAMRLASLAEKASLLFVYDNLDGIEMYVSNYDVELRKVLIEIQKYLKNNVK